MSRWIVLVFIFLTVGCSDSGLVESKPSSFVQAQPRPIVERIESDVGVGAEFQEPKVDILFVIDNSGSMSVHQANLAANANRFIQNFTQIRGLDFHVGVVSTDAGSAVPCCGRLVGTPTFVTKTTPNIDQVLGQKFVLGTSGSPEEASFEPVRLALSAPNLDGYNKDFYRQDAYLALIFITDAEDQSRALNPDTFLSFLTRLKGDPAKIFAYGAIVPSNDILNCPRDDGTPPRRIEDFLAKMPNTGTNIFNLCDPAFGDKLADVGKDLAGRVSGHIILQRRPVVDTIQVYFGSQPILRGINDGWSFDPSRNAVVLGNQIVWTIQPEGTKIRVSYDVAEEK